MRTRKLATLVALASIAACSLPTARPPPAPPVGPSSGRAAPAAHRVDPDASELRVLVHRAGPLAALGHNHVIVHHALEGVVRWSPDLRSATFELRIPVAGFVVDPPEARREEGEDFPGEIPADARAGTLHNLLGPALLDAQRHPVIVLDGDAAVGADGVGAATVRAVVAGHDATFPARFTLDPGTDRIRIRGTADLRQSALGLTPFTALLGALQVRDDFTVRFDLAAETRVMPPQGP